MQKISTFLSAALALSLTAIPLQAQEETDAPVWDAVEDCFGERERLERLRCYDQVLERPELTDTRDPDGGNEVTGPGDRPQALDFVEKLLRGPDELSENVHVTLIERSTGDALPPRDEATLALLKGALPDGQFAVRKLETNLFLAMHSDPKIGEDVKLVLSCENNITRLKFYFKEPFEGRFENARFYGRQTLSQADGERRKLWVRADGYVLENARGLDSIRLVQRLTAGDLGQVSVGDGEAVKSAFFDTRSLSGALPMIRRHCSWSPR